MVTPRLAVFVVALLALAPGVRAGFSDDELRAIYGQMKPAIRCGMTEEHFMSKYRGCAENSLHCDGSLIVMGEKGQCVDRLIFENMGSGPGGDPLIILNGHRFPIAPVPVPGKRKPTPAVDSPS